MEHSLLNTIENLRVKKQELEQLDLDIQMKREENKRKIEEEEKKFNEVIKSSEENLKRMKMEFIASIQNQTVSIALKDLVEELSKLTGISILNMGVKIILDIESPMFDLTPLLNKDFSNSIFHILLCGDSSLEFDDDTQPFAYRIEKTMDLKEKQADGKIFLEHCSSKQSRNGLTHKLVFDKRIGDLIVKVDFEKLFMSDDRFDWYPVDLMTTTITNCLEQGKVITREEQQKVKQKIK